MVNYAKHVSPAATPQSQPLPGRTDMVKNAGGGYVFQVSDMERVRRFLILGSEGGTYYASEAKLTRDNAATVLAALDADATKVIDLAVEVSDKGLAPKNDPAIFVLALASVSKDVGTRQYALSKLSEICRIPTHLFTFVQFRHDLGGGWGRGARKAVAAWYTKQSPTGLAINALKYQSRNGWAHRDLLRLAHPVTKDAGMVKVFDAISQPAGGERRAPSTSKTEPPRNRGDGAGWEGLRSISVVDGWLKIQAGDLKPAQAAKVITDHRLQREFIPTELLTSAEVWEALLPNLGYTALLRNLGTMSKVGLLAPLSAASKYVQAKLGEGESITKARVHPFSVLLALRTYAQGHGFKGSNTWTVVPQVVDALDSAFDLSFGNIVPTGKRFILGIDVSSSMSTQINGSPISSAEAAAAFAMITARTEPAYGVFGFTDRFQDLKVTARDSLATVCTKVQQRNFGSTDCAVPLRWARQNKVVADAVLVYTDNETHAGPTHALTELQAYRKESSINTKLGLVAFTATAHSVADPTDAGSMNFVGLDGSLPQAIAAFVTG